MKRIKQRILALLLAALVLGLVPVSGASPQTPDYGAADAVFSRIYSSLLGRRAPASDESRADRVERILEDAPGVVPGSVRRSGNDLVWQTEGGVACRFSPYLYRLLTRDKGAVSDAAEPPRKALSAEGRDVSLFAPYYGMDDDFEGVGGTYDTWGAILARFTGGAYHRWEGRYATVGRIAEALAGSAVVLFDTHGETDARYRTSYICLQSGEGLTEADYAYDPAAGVNHALYGGRGAGGSVYYEVDGTVIANHMSSDARGCLIWNGSCHGMGTQGICKPLMDRGVGAIYGYSRDVSFGGDRCWMETFMDELTSGKTVRESLQAAKKRWGEWDLSPEICARYHWSQWADHTLSEAIESGKAFPVLVSAEDPYPANPSGLQTVRCDWRLPQVELEVRMHVPDGVKCADIQGYVFYRGKLPTPAGIPRDQSRAYRFTGWSLYPFDRSRQLPAVYAPGAPFSFGFDEGEPLSFGFQSADLYGVYAYEENGVTWYTTQVPDGPYDPYDPSALFSDMAFGTWYYQYVRFAAANGLVNGYTDGTFKPENTVKRSEVVSILYRAAGSPAPAEAAGFPDVAEGDWFAPAVAWAQSSGIVLGYDDGLFHPERPVTRAQLAVFFCRYALARTDGDDALRAFPDQADVPGWARSEMAWAVEQGLINGSRIGGVDYLKPLNQATRAQFVAILNRYLDNTNH